MISFLTLNVRGLRKRKKRHSAFRWLRKQKCDFVFIQEAYVQEKDFAQWRCDWGGEFFSVCDSVHSKGLIILFSSKCQAKVLNVIKDDMKRYIFVKVEIDNVKYNLWNFYGPNNENQKFAFVDLIIITF